MPEGKKNARIRDRSEVPTDTIHKIQTSPWSTDARLRLQARLLRWRTYGNLGRKRHSTAMG